MTRVIILVVGSFGVEHGPDADKLGDVSNKTSITLGLRYSDDDKEYTNLRTQSPLNFLGFPDLQSGEVNVSDSHVSWDVSITHKYTADSFRAPNIQGRSLFAFDEGI
jgi:iron complex outermembrane receptor protein